MKSSIKVASVVCALVVLLVAISFIVGEMTPPRPATCTTMYCMKRRILRYASVHNVLPHSAGELPVIDRYHNGVKDGWGRVIHWQAEGNRVTLVSYGRDGIPGGIGEDADVIGVFLTKTTDGSWTNEDCEWIRDPLHDKGEE
jgi:hypothetical protein